MHRLDNLRRDAGSSAERALPDRFYCGGPERSGELEWGDTARDRIIQLTVPSDFAVGFCPV